MKSLIVAAGIALLSTVVFAQTKPEPTLPNIEKICVQGADKVVNLLQTLGEQGYRVPLQAIIINLKPNTVQYTFGNPSNQTVVEIEVKLSANLTPEGACIKEVGLFVPLQNSAPQQPQPEAPKVEVEPKDQE